MLLIGIPYFRSNIYFYSIMSVVIEEIKKFFCLFLRIPNIVSFCHFII